MTMILQSKSIFIQCLYDKKYILNALYAEDKSYSHFVQDTTGLT